ncbi:unnamed protein product [Ambrosiozyma monospora]|uniref:Glucan 1,3-beta-glucosidase n=1 Tax=Ambrosiozyma monospora TaxID=43982 RepID=A0A9W7DGN6_AMBMO|nr:unnamed protein product [Ambrosiozyma monospora]
MKISTICSLAVSLLSVVSAAPLQLKKRNSRWDYQNDKLYGVNAGGWLLLEPFITPSIFTDVGGDESNWPVDEYHYTKQLGKEEASEKLQEHWSTWITEDDFAKMAEYGLNFVRIPIGYWAFELLDDDPYVQGQVEYLDKAIGWAKNNSLKIWIDLHGVPGGQNGFDNSGIRDQLNWQSSDVYLNLTAKVLNDIASKYSSSDYDDVVIGIELVNEPNGSALDLNKLAEYYNEGYEIVREYGDVPVIIQDGFRPDHYWDNTLNTEENPDYWDVVVDHHHYQVFSHDELTRSIDEHVSVACGLGTSEGAEYHWNIIGEWSAALTDCARWLNGLGRGARYDNTYQGAGYIGSCDGYYIGNKSVFSGETWNNYRKFVEAQLDAYEQSKVGGWAFWTWKTETSIEWSFSKLVEVNVIPQPLSDRQFSNQCGY